MIGGVMEVKSTSPNEVWCPAHRGVTFITAIRPDY